MFGKNSHLNRLQSRKALLLAESELNRAQLGQDWQTIKHQTAVLARQALTISAIVAAGTTLLAGLTAWRQHRPAPAAPPEKPSWFGKLLKGAALASTLLTVLRPPPRA